MSGPPSSAEIERLAREQGVRELHLESSLTAELFYATLGYRVETRGEHAIGPTVKMAAVTMRKRLGLPFGSFTQ